LATGFADTTRQNLEFLNDVVSGNMMSKDAVRTARAARETASSSKVYEEEEEYDDEEEDEGEDRVPSFLRTLKRRR
jgi:hypothetical protein